MYFDSTWFIFILPALLLSLWAQFRVKSAFSKYSKVPARLTGSQACRFFIYLDGGHVAPQFYYLANQMLLADTDHIIKLYIAHAAGNDQRA